MFVIKHKFFFIISIAIIMLASIGATAYFGITESIDFTGGSVVEGEYAVGTRPDVELIRSAIDPEEFGTIKIQPIGDNGVITRSRELTLTEHNKLVALLSTSEAIFTETNFSTIGPSVGQELRQKAITSIILVLILIIIFAIIAFRSVGKIVSAWKYGLSIIICLAHDIFVPVGIFAILAHYFVGYEIDTLFVTALLAILGYSVADTIVVFDRVRENIKNSNLDVKRPSVNGESFENLVGRSLGETYARSISTSLTTILAALAIFFFGGESTKHFALMLAIGIAVGTYSSILLASPLLVIFAGKSNQAKSK